MYETNRLHNHNNPHKDANCSNPKYNEECLNMIFKKPIEIANKLREIKQSPLVVM
jgi:hypothetical protein